MKLIDYILLLAVAALLAVAVHFARKGRSCCSHCQGCDGKCGRKS